MVQHSAIDHTGIPGVGGGGVTHAYVGYDTIGGSSENIAARIFLKKVTFAGDCLIASAGAYVKQVATSQSLTMGAAVLTDNAGTPELLVAHTSPLSTSLFLSTSNGSLGAARWVHMPLGLWVAAGDYWIEIYLSGSSNYNIYYDGSGSDRTYVPGADRLSDAGWTTVTTTSNRYSIRASILA